MIESARCGRCDEQRRTRTLGGRDEHLDGGRQHRSRALLEATFPFIDPQSLLRGLGFAEVLLGVALLCWSRSVIPLALIGSHLAGTFVTIALAPERLFAHGNPLLITTEGEFVTKNIILIGAIVMLAGRRLNQRRHGSSR